jgi:hypothetical protein
VKIAAVKRTVALSPHKNWLAFAILASKKEYGKDSVTLSTPDKGVSF